MNKEVKVTWLSQEECVEAGAMDMAQILDYVKMVNIWLAEGKITESELLHLLWDEGVYSGRRIGVHASLIRSEEMMVASVKGIPSNPDNPVRLGMPRSNGLIILYDEASGFPFAVMDDTLVSSLRTGASSTLGALYCANPDAEILGLVGCGPIQDAYIEATSLVIGNIKSVRLYDLVHERAQLFAQK